jgi:hypothetical protein
VYKIIGEIVFILILASVLLTALALFVSRMSVNRNVWLAGSLQKYLTSFICRSSICSTNFLIQDTR